MKASVEEASFHAKYFGRFLLSPSDPLSARYALLMGPLPAKHPVRTLATRNCSNVQDLRMPQLWSISPNPDPARVKHKTIFLPRTSLRDGQSRIPNIIPRGYAEEREPKDAPIGREK
jgi:hypothetical protein